MTRAAESVAEVPPVGADGLEPTEDSGGGGSEWAATRLRFRRWRRSRPFWAGLWTLLGGAVIIWVAASDVNEFLNAGQIGMTTVLPGIVLVIAGLFLWFSPANRTLAGVLALVFAVASLVISNLGGFGLGMLLGIIGGSMALGWTDEPRRPRRRRASPGLGPGRMAAVGVALAMVALSLPVDRSVAVEDEAGERVATECLLPEPVGMLLDRLAVFGTPPTDCPLDLHAADLESVEALVDALVGLDRHQVDTALSAIGAGPLLAAVVDLDAEAVRPAVAFLSRDIQPSSSTDGPLSAADLLGALAARVDGFDGLDDAPIDEILHALATLLESVTDLAGLINQLLGLLRGVVDVVDLPLFEPEPAPGQPSPVGDAHARSPGVRTAALGHDTGHVAPTVTSDLKLATLETTNLVYDGTVTHRTAHGSVEVIRFVIDRIDATGLDLSLPSGHSAIADLANREGGSVVGTGVVLDCVELSLNITGVRGAAIPPPLSDLLNVPLTLRPGSPDLVLLGAVLDVLPEAAVLVSEDVVIDLVTLSAAEIDLLGLGGSAR